MKRPNLLLIAGIAISAVVHGAFIETLVVLNSSETARRLFKQSTFVPIEVKRPEPPPPPPPKPKPRPQPKPVTPPPNTEKPSPPPEEEVKPVFGVTKDTVATADTGIGVRIGNTLMKEMEKEYTPPEEVKDLPKVEVKRPPEPRFNPVAAFKLARMPEIKDKVRPDYPRELRADGVEGEVLLRVSVDRTGKVVSVTVVASDHELFAKAAVAAVRGWKFAPARLASGEEADAVIEIPVIFQLDF